MQVLDSTTSTKPSPSLHPQECFDWRGCEEKQKKECRHWLQAAASPDNDGRLFQSPCDRREEMKRLFKRPPGSTVTESFLQTPEWFCCTSLQITVCAEEKSPGSDPKSLDFHLLSSDLCKWARCSITFLFLDKVRARTCTHAQARRRQSS